MLILRLFLRIYGRRGFRFLAQTQDLILLKNALRTRQITFFALKQVFHLEAPSLPGTEEKPFRVAFVGHPYNLYDIDVNKDILSFAKDLGMRIITPEDLSEKEIDKQVSDLSKEIYWSSGREIVGALFHFLSGGVDGVVFLTSFKCGIDALLQEFVRRRLKGKDGSSIPFLILTLDEHSGREGLTTRLEAFRDVMEERKQHRKSLIQDP